MPDALSCLMGILLIVFLYVVVSRVRHWFQRMKKKLLRSRTGEYIRYDVRLLVAFLRKCGIPKISKMNDIEWLREVMYQSPAMFVENDLDSIITSLVSFIFPFIITRMAFTYRFLFT